MRGAFVSYKKSDIMRFVNMVKLSSRRKTGSLVQGGGERTQNNRSWVRGGRSFLHTVSLT